MKTKRRAVLKKLFATAAGVTGVSALANAETNGSYVQAVQSLDNLVLVSGAGAHVAPFNITNHTEIVFRDLERYLKSAGSSMDKVLKVRVWLDNMADFAEMNKVYQGKFGPNPPVRTTVAVQKGGVPSDSLIEIDAIAYK